VQLFLSTASAFEFDVIFSCDMMPVIHKATLAFMAALSLIAGAINSHAGLGWTLAQAKQQYGKVVFQELIVGRTGYVFTPEDYIIAAFFLKAQVSRILYICRSGSGFDWGRARALLRADAPDAVWSDASKNEAENYYRIIGIKDGVEAYYASLADDGKMLAIWTKQDDEAGRTMPKFDVPQLSSIGDSNEKSGGEINAVKATNVDDGLTPETDRPDVQTNATSGSPSRWHDSARVADTKNPKVKRRSSMHPRYVSVKTRLIALWHQSLRNEKSRGKASSSKR